MPTLAAPDPGLAQRVRALRTAARGLGLRLEGDALAEYELEP